jgi:hypothetical protein
MKTRLTLLALTLLPLPFFHAQLTNVPSWEVGEHPAGQPAPTAVKLRAHKASYIRSIELLRPAPAKTAAQRLRDLKMKADERANDRGKPVTTMKRPDNGMPEDIRQHMRLMCDLIALAFQTDKTRIATLLLCRDVSGLIYPFLNARASHHSSSHYDKAEEYQRITTYYASQFAYLVQKLDAMPEGEGTVLDNSCLMFINNFWSGSKHESTRVPVLLSGGLGGTLQTGRVLNYQDKGDGNRKLCSMYLSLMDRMGVKLDRLADSDARLAGI